MALPPLPMVSPHARRSLASSPQSTTGYSKSADQIWGGLVSPSAPRTPAPPPPAFTPCAEPHPRAMVPWWAWTAAAPGWSVLMCAPRIHVAPPARATRGLPGCITTRPTPGRSAPPTIACSDVCAAGLACWCDERAPFL